MSSRYAIASDRPVSRAWTRYSGNATNMKENSSGSVTPVRNAVRPAAERMPTATFRWPGLATWIIASAAAGRPNMRIG